MSTTPAHRLATGDVIGEAFGPRAGEPLGTVVEVRTHWADDLVEIVLDPADGSARRTDLVRPTFPVPVVATPQEATR